MKRLKAGNPVVRGRITMLVIFALLVLAGHRIRYNWAWHARFSLLQNGIIFAELVPASEHNMNGNHDFAQVVCLKGKNLGYLDDCAVFVPHGSEASYDELVRRDSFLLGCVFFLGVAGVVGILLILLSLFLEMLLQGKGVKCYRPN